MRWFEPGWRHSAARISAVGLGLLALVAPARADDTVDPTSGKLAVTVVDIAVSGGAVVLPVMRSLGGGDGAFGAAWSSNWDEHLAKSQSGKTLVLIQGGTTVNFVADGNQYKAEAARRLPASAAVLRSTGPISLPIISIYRADGPSATTTTGTRPP